MRTSIRKYQSFCFAVTFLCWLVRHHYSKTKRTLYNDEALYNDEVLNNSQSNFLYDHEGVSACLLVKDAVNELPEWLAYHYHFLPLRYVIVAVDPTSTMNHTPILSQFNRSLNEGDLTVIEWGEKDIQPDLEMVAVESNVEEMTLEQHLVHQNRQNTFITKCIVKMKQLNRTWTFLHDVDEFVYLNEEAARTTKNWSARSTGTRFSRHIMQEIPNDISLLPEESPFCFPVPRVRVGAVESPKTSYPDANDNGNAIKMDSIHNFDRFVTLRFRHHAQTRHWYHNLHVKSVVHASNFKGNLTNVDNPHVPFSNDGCNFENYRDDYYLTSPLIIQHYTGSRTSYLSRPRGVGGVQKFEFSRDLCHDSKEVDPWIEEFIRIHGEQTASSLLNNAHVK